MSGFHPTRRRLLGGAGALGLALWAGSAATPAKAAARRRLVLVVLDGGADGLSLAPPLDSGRYRDLRGALAVRAPLPFDADFGLHPSLKRVSAMAAEGQVRLAPAAGSHTLTRSHFLERDILESGAGDGRPASTGWLNRAVGALGGEGPLQAVALESAASLAATGPAGFGAWTPGFAGLDPGFAGRLEDLYAGDAQLRGLVRTERAMTQALVTTSGGPAGESDEVQRARTAGRLLAAADGPSAALLRLGGFDTHVGQGADEGLLAARFAVLDAMLDALRIETGAAWADTAVLVFTEFGRTAAVNGVGGTDHGGGSAALVLGGAVGRSGLVGDWPGLAPAALRDGRELHAALDLRSLFKGVLAEHWGFGPERLDRTIFPGSGAVRPALGLLRTPAPTA